MNVAIYARVSTSDGREDTRNQLIELQQFAASQNWNIVAQYVDEEIGATADRPQFRQLLHDASRRRFDLILFWALDRMPYRA